MRIQTMQERFASIDGKVLIKVNCAPSGMNIVGTVSAACKDHVRILGVDGDKTNVPYSSIAIFYETK